MMLLMSFLLFSVFSVYNRFFLEGITDLLQTSTIFSRNTVLIPVQFSKFRRNNTACIGKYHHEDSLVHLVGTLMLFNVIISGKSSKK